MEGSLGKYRIIAKLGQGGMATVFLSVVPGPMGVNKLLVIKVLRDELSSDADFLSMFLNEARLAARLNHANVVHTYEVGVAGQHHFLAMDYLDGQPLHALLRKASRARMPLDVHVRILADMLAGLDYAHTLKDFDGTPLHVVHRDVSPQNAFVTYDGQVKLVDFGIAKAAGAASTTQSGVFKGKLAYVAPEQAAGDPVDARADLFSVGVMLWEAIAARRFAHGESQTALLAKRLSGTEPRIRDVVPDADLELADICDRAMAHDPADRFASARQFQDALESFLDRFSRRVGRREVGELISSLFVEERERIRAVIDEQMKRLHRETSTTLPLPSLDALQASAEPPPVTTIEPATGRRLGGPPSAPPSDTSAGLSASHGTLVAANIPPRGAGDAARGRTILIALTAVAIASLAGIVVIVVLKRPAEQAAPAAPAEATASTPDTSKLRMSITFGPPGAVAKLDGFPLPESPFIAQVPRDGSMHTLEVEGPGLAKKTSMLSYDKDVDLTISLEPAPEPSAATSTSASAAPIEPSVRPTGRLPTTVSTGTKQPREIDEDNPYKKKK
ncbi:MAG: serine/threonine protein kinase [Polyangiaceae bacterium]|jgi:serine/threonine protein kinase|nr:serine/threonine protein kinase [Polyangiaceae bacterium]